MKIALSMVLFGGTQCAFDDRAWTKMDSWYAEVPKSLPPWYDSKWAELGEEHIVRVIAAKQKEATQLLLNQAWLALSAKQCEEFAGRPVAAEGASPYLVRAVFLNHGNGVYRVTVCDGYVCVAHGCMGAFPIPMKREAIIVFLREPPSAVYPTCGMTQ